MITLERMAVLREVALFARMGTAELARIAKIGEEVVVAAGEPVFTEGEFGDALFVVLAGSVSITQRGRVLKTLGERSYFGEMSLLDGEARSATVKAAADCLLLRIRRQDFQQILAQHPDVASAVIRTLTSRVRTAEKQGEPAETNGETR